MLSAVLRWRLRQRKARRLATAFSRCPHRVLWRSFAKIASSLNGARDVIAGLGRFVEFVEVCNRLGSGGFFQCHAAYVAALGEALAQEYAEIAGHGLLLQATP